jgi:hypothetical protein
MKTEYTPRSIRLYNPHCITSCYQPGSPLLNGDSALLINFPDKWCTREPPPWTISNIPRITRGYGQCWRYRFKIEKLTVDGLVRVPRSTITAGVIGLESGHPNTALLHEPCNSESFSSDGLLVAVFLHAEVWQSFWCGVLTGILVLEARLTHCKLYLRIVSISWSRIIKYILLCVLETSAADQHLSLSTLQTLLRTSQPVTRSLYISKEEFSNQQYERRSTSRCWSQWSRAWPGGNWHLVDFHDHRDFRRDNAYLCAQKHRRIELGWLAHVVCDGTFSGTPTHQNIDSEDMLRLINYQTGLSIVRLVLCQ